MLSAKQRLMNGDVTPSYFSKKRAE
jgi:hypothetical protein